MSRRALTATVAAFALVLALGAAAAAAGASTQQESGFQDDPLLVFGSPATVGSTLDTLKSLGVDRVRVSVFWRLVAPDGGSKTKPAGFDGADPSAYPQANWARYDTLIAAIRARGMDVTLDITSPAPLWATGSPDRADIEQTYEPDPAEFGAFVTAVGTRYSGGYTVPAAPPTATPGTGGGSGSGGGGLVIPGITSPSRSVLATAATAAPRQVAAGTVLPKVDSFELYNEPNQPGWLTPQWVPNGKSGFVEAAPRLYRGLVDAAYAGLVASGHARDTILIGATAPKGLNVKGQTRAIKALRFVRLVYCLDSSYHPLKGSTATVRGCPAKPNAAAFRAAHPALFRASGWSHHPYELTFSPHTRPTDPDFVTIANLPSLTTALRRSLAAYGTQRPGGLPLYLTEFGYQSNPPDKTGVTLTQQAAYLDEAEFRAYANPNVRVLTQFLLHDDAPVDGDYGATFQSGIEFNDGRPKPAFAAYRLPIFLPHTTFARGASVRIWGMVRPAAAGTAAKVSIQFRTPKAKTWTTIAHVSADAARGYVDRRVRVPGTGSVRLRSGAIASRAVNVRRR